MSLRYVQMSLDLIISMASMWAVLVKKAFTTATFSFLLCACSVIWFSITLCHILFFFYSDVFNSVCIFLAIEIRMQSFHFRFRKTKFCKITFQFDTDLKQINLSCHTCTGLQDFTMGIHLIFQHGLCSRNIHYFYSIIVSPINEIEYE